MTCVVQVRIAKAQVQAQEEAETMSTGSPATRKNAIFADRKSEETRR